MRDNGSQTSRVANERVVKNLATKLETEIIRVLFRAIEPKQHKKLNRIKYEF